MSVQEKYNGEKCLTSTVIKWYLRFVLAGKWNEKIRSTVAYAHSEKGKIEVPTNGGVAGGLKWVDLSGRQRPRGGKLYVLYKNAIFFRTKFWIIDIK
jgi:hypothetical protein